MAKNQKAINQMNLTQLSSLENELDSFIDIYKHGSMFRDEDLTRLNIYKAFLNNLHHDINQLKKEVIHAKKILKHYDY